MSAIFFVWQLFHELNQVGSNLNVIFMGHNDIMETISALLAFCEGNPLVTGRFPLTKVQYVALR